MTVRKKNVGIHIIFIAESTAFCQLPELFGDFSVRFLLFIVKCPFYSNH